MKFEYFGLSDKGRIRENNEDAFIIDKTINFAAIADGMGGHKSGEVASNIAVNNTLSYLKQYIKKIKTISHINKDYSIQTNMLVAAVDDANLDIYTKAQESENSGMGTTLTSVLFTDSSMSIVHIGDSRAYLIRNNEITQLTEDDSFVMEQYKSGKMTLEEAEHSPFKNVLTKALGIKKENSYFIKEEKVTQGDIILISSDGLTKMLSDKEIKQTIINNKDIKTATIELIKKANIKGGDDNITVILIRILSKSIIDRIRDVLK